MLSPLLLFLCVVLGGHIYSPQPAGQSHAQAFRFILSLTLGCIVPSPISNLPHSPLWVIMFKSEVPPKPALTSSGGQGPAFLSWSARKLGLCSELPSLFSLPSLLLASSPCPSSPAHPPLSPFFLFFSPYLFLAPSRALLAPAYPHMATLITVLSTDHFPFP